MYKFPVTKYEYCNPNRGAKVLQNCTNYFVSRYDVGVAINLTSQSSVLSFLVCCGGLANYCSKLLLYFIWSLPLITAPNTKMGFSKRSFSKSVKISHCAVRQTSLNLAIPASKCGLYCSLAAGSP